MRLVRAIIVGVTLAGIVACGQDAEVQACVDRGVSYFKEIGSYPTLQSSLYAGRSAEDVANERCNRTTTAF
jgi:hypothetical protein